MLKTIHRLIAVCLLLPVASYANGPADSPSAEQAQGQDQGQDQSQSNDQTATLSTHPTLNVDTDIPRVTALIAGGSSAGSGTAPCLRSLRSWIMVGGKQKVDEACWAEYLKQSEHDRAMDLAELDLAETTAEREHDYRMAMIRLESLRLENCLECSVQK